MYVLIVRVFCYPPSPSPSPPGGRGQGEGGKSWARVIEKLSYNYRRSSSRWGRLSNAPLDMNRVTSPARASLTNASIKWSVVGE